MVFLHTQKAMLRMCIIRSFIERDLIVAHVAFFQQTWFNQRKLGGPK